jgi:hypothetical protein
VEADFLVEAGCFLVEARCFLVEVGFLVEALQAVLVQESVAVMVVAQVPVQGLD